MKKINQAILILLMSVMLLPAWAKGADVAAAENRVLNITRNIVKLMDANFTQYNTNQALLNAMVRKEVLPFIDFDAMSKLTLGKHWRKASKNQRSRFINAYREMLVRSYARTMLKYTGAKISSGNSVPNKKSGYALVRTMVSPKKGGAIAANYSVRKVSGDWKAYNVEIAGVNLITNFRTNFTREVSAKGLNALIARLEKSGK